MEQRIRWLCNMERTCSNYLCGYNRNSPVTARFQWDDKPGERLNEVGDLIYEFLCPHSRKHVTVTKKKAVAEYKVYKRKEVK